MTIDETSQDFLRELCDIIRRYHDDLIASGHDSQMREMMFPKAFREDYGSILTDDEQLAKILPFVRHALTSAIFNVLVLLDEHKELGDTKVEPYLKLMRDGVEVPCPNYLHEVFGDVMHSMGMDLYEWWGVK